MLRRRAELTVIRVAMIFAAGLVAGVQIALYLFDFYDDGIADVRSAVIGLVLLTLGVGLLAWSFRRTPDNPRPPDSVGT